MSELSKLPNVGKVLDKLLTESGIATAEQLRNIGTKEAFIKIRMIDPTVCIQMLYGLHGAVEGVKDKFLDEKTKEILREFYKSL